MASNKRRRISGTQHNLADLVLSADDVEPVEVHSCAGGHVMSAAGEQPPGFVVEEPPLEGIAKLLLEDLQHKCVTEVGNALYKLQDLVTTAHANSEQNRREAYDLGAHIMALMAMRKWPLNEKVQLYACSFITLLAKREQKGYRMAFVQAGGFHTIVKALQTFPEEKCLQSSGFRAIYNLIHDDFDYLHKFVNQMDGIQVLLRPMTKYTDHTCLLTACCAVFGLLAKEPEFRGPLKAAGVVSAVAMISEKHVDNRGIQTHAGIFMKRVYS